MVWEIDGFVKRKGGGRREKRDLSFTQGED